MQALADSYAKFKKAPRQVRADSKVTTKLRNDMAEVFVTLKLPLPLTDVLVRNLRDVQNGIKERERRVLHWPPLWPGCRARISSVPGKATRPNLGGWTKCSSASRSGLRRCAT